MKSNNKEKHIILIILIIAQPIIWYFIYYMFNPKFLLKNTLHSTDGWMMICTVTCILICLSLMWYKEAYLND